MTSVLSLVMAVNIVQTQKQVGVGTFLRRAMDSGMAQMNGTVKVMMYSLVAC